jgi:hypothetical protein
MRPRTDTRRNGFGNHERAMGVGRNDGPTTDHELAQPLRSFALLLHRHMAIDVRRDAIGRMPEQLLHNLEMSTGRNQRRGRAMPERVQSHLRQASTLRDTRERPKRVPKVCGRAYVRREHQVVMVRPRHVVPEDQRVPDLHDQLLAAEGAAVLGWAFRGAVEVLARGLADPQAVTKATREYEIFEDTLASFVQEECLLAPSYWSAAGELRGRYKRHCEEMGAEPLTAKALPPGSPAKYPVTHGNATKDDGSTEESALSVPTRPANEDTSSKRVADSTPSCTREMRARAHTQVMRLSPSTRERDERWGVWGGADREGKQRDLAQRCWSTLCHVVDHLWKSFGPILGEIKPVDGLGEAQVGVDTGNDNAGVDGEQFDAHKGDANIDIDHQTLVQDRVDDISEAARRRAVEIAVGRVGCDGHGINSRERVDGSLAAQAHRVQGPRPGAYDARGRA